MTSCLKRYKIPSIMDFINSTYIETLFEERKSTVERHIVTYGPRPLKVFRKPVIVKKCVIPQFYKRMQYAHILRVIESCKPEFVGRVYHTRLKFDKITVYLKDYGGEDMLTFVQREYDGLYLTGDAMIPRQKLYYNLFYQICEGIQNLHSLNIVHGDLKLENVMIQNDTARIIDFDGAFDLTYGLPYTKELAMTQHYISPERYFDKRINKSNDVWSFGILIYLFFEHTFPYSTEEFQMFQNRRSNRSSDSINFTFTPLRIRKLIRELLVVNCNGRISIEETLNRLRHLKK